MAHDELWNLHPTTKSINSSKSNHLPDWTTYFPEFARVEYGAYEMVWENEKVHTDFDILSMCCRKEEGTLLSSLVLYEWIARKYHIRRNGEVGEDIILQGVFRNLLDMLVVRGDLAEGRMDGEGIGYRTIRKEEQLRSENAA